MAKTTAPALTPALLAAFVARGGVVAKVATASPETVKASVSAYWADVRHFSATGETPAQREAREASAAEHEAECRMERYGAARLDGLSVSDALDYSNGW